MATPTLTRVPPLQAGDRLSVTEFLRRYEAMPQVKKAELIEGVVYMPSPVNNEYHGHPHVNMIGWLGLYQAHTPGIQGGDNSTLRLKLGPNVPQPDGFLRILPEYGGQSRTNKRGYVVGSPELIGEVSATSASYDLHDKLEAYERNGVQEYVVWRMLDRAVDWFSLRQNKFRLLPLSDDGIFRSKVFPGLWLDARALLQGNLVKVFAAVQQGLATPEHGKFVEKLRKWHEDHARSSAKKEGRNGK